VLREIVHLLCVLAEVESLRQSIDTVWKDEVGGQLVGGRRPPAGGTRAHRRVTLETPDFSRVLARINK
jgi:hypothetical protein